MDNASKLKIALAAKKKLASQTAAPSAGLKRGTLNIGGKLKKEVNPFMKA